MVTEDLAAWLTQIWDEREAIARAVAVEGRPLEGGSGSWFESDRSIGDKTGYVVAYGVEWDAARKHIVNHDPATVLARIAADRQILSDYHAEVAKHQEHWERQLARPAAELHADRVHPHYEYATTEGPRKTWDDSDVPPIDRETWEPQPGWERNVDQGRNGWERFDYMEESYWRRMLPEDQWRRPFVPPVPRHIKLMASAHADRPGYREEWRP